MMKPDVTVTFDASEVLRVTKRPPAGAALDRVTGNCILWLGPTITLAGKSSPLVSVTVAVVSAMFGRELAWMVVEPDAKPVTGTETLVAPAEKLTVGGTKATVVFVELRLMVSPPAGAGVERFSVRF